ncbi:hypothetical protein SE17_01970 [Kouleothrix aurantiaca]|uniref:Uncharacterized protein n=1 Tax=Kouleothrix aurantiaca TaxID=186479 RepID=A0A0P9HIP5_9CHLR|nr:hypothetical protein SE17_01970 [Kouleothrix aurantiaca]
MHELGHALSLDHGGPTKLVDLGLATSAEVGDQNYKPNYFSVMNYAYQVGNLLKQQGTNRYDMVIDYSRSQLNNLVENQLDELVGVPSQYNYKLPQYWCDDKLKPAINLDWNCDGDANDNPVQADINRPKNKPAASASDTLRGFADWPYLKYDNGPIGRPGITADPDPASEYISHDAADDELIPLMRAYDVTVQGEGTILVRPGTSFLYTLWY